MKIKESFRKLVENATVRIKIENIDLNWKMPYQIGNIQSGLGSGFFINPEYIVTCAHVVDGAKNVYIEIPSRGSDKIDVEILGICPEFDTALLKTKKYKSKYYFEIGDSRKCNIGDEVLVVGYPKNYSMSKSDVNNLKYTQGIISGQQYGLIQTDSAINSGNSGGPMIKDKKVIGINSRKAIGDDTDSIGYAVPIHYFQIIQSNFHQLKPSNQIIYRPSLGFEYSNTNEYLLNYLTSDSLENGVYVSYVYDKSPLKKIGVKEGDIITKIDKYKVDSFGLTDYKWFQTQQDINSLMNNYKLNSKIPIEFYQEGKKKKKVIELKEYVPNFRIQYPLFEKVDYYVICGMVFMNLAVNHMIENIDLIKKYTEPEEEDKPKVVISFIFPNSPSFILNNFSNNDILTKLNQKEIHHIHDFEKILKKTIHFKGKEYVQFENQEKKVIMMPLTNLIANDILLSQIYQFELSPFHLEMINKLKKKDLEKMMKNVIKMKNKMKNE